jgi:hypothetical protein
MDRSSGLRYEDTEFQFSEFIVNLQNVKDILRPFTAEGFNPDKFKSGMGCISIMQHKLGFIWLMICMCDYFGDHGNYIFGLHKCWEFLDQLSNY